MKYLLALMLVTIVSTGFAATISGPVTLKFDDSPFSKDGFTKEFGETVKATCNWRAGDFFGKQTVFAGITVKNTGKKAMFFNYYVAFFDKEKKLIGATGQGSFSDDGLAPGKEEQLGSCMIFLPKDRYKDITSYQAIIYESDTPPAKR
jgi:hypothetical protein